MQTWFCTIYNRKLLQFKNQQMVLHCYWLIYDLWSANWQQLWLGMSNAMLCHAEKSWALCVLKILSLWISWPFLNLSLAQSWAVRYKWWGRVPTLIKTRPLLSSWLKPQKPLLAQNSHREYSLDLQCYSDGWCWEESQIVCFSPLLSFKILFFNVMAIDDDGRVGRIECPPFLGIGRLTRKLSAKHGPGRNLHN